jgi:hypothetical protein
MDKTQLPNFFTCMLNGYTAHAVIARARYPTHLYSARDNAKQSNSVVLYKTHFKTKH